MAQAVGNVRREGRRDANAEQPLRQSRDRHLAARRVKQHHRTGIDQPVHRERDQASRPASLAIRPHQRVSVPIGRDRSDRHHADHRARSRSPDDPICPGHRTPPAASLNSVVRAISIMYVRCESGLGHDICAGQRVVIPLRAPRDADLMLAALRVMTYPR